MIPEIGNGAIILALCFALIQGMTLFRDTKAKLSIPHSIGCMAALGQCLFLSLAMLCLIVSFLTNDMTVVYVLEHSHRSLPVIYRIGAAWGGHEGSLLLWCLILSGWTVVFMLVRVLMAQTSLSIEQHMMAILGFISAGFIAFLFFTSDPFKRIFPRSLLIGNDLTPVLQDPGLIFHPPMLYLGYVGFAIGFAFAISALIAGKLEKSWAEALRPWIILPWSFLSIGIVLGSWWAYRELGWGGWWFWDPVENASLLPWLSATALIHALIVSEKRDAFKGWTILLAIITFTLSLLGTFLVRSGILVSVHTFANDPTRGIFLLCYLTLIIGGALICYALRIKHFYRAPTFSVFSRETFLLINSVVMLTAVATICLGTLYPILLDALQLEKISVGEPYFNTVFLPLMLVVLLLMGVAPHVRWGHQRFFAIWKKLRLTLLLSVALGCAGPLLAGFPFHWLASVGVSFSVWIILATLQYLLQLQQTHRSIERQHWAMIIAHLGIALLALGITLNKSYSEERQVKMLPGESATLAGYQFTLQQLDTIHGQNYQSTVTIFDVHNQHRALPLLRAEQRIYQSHDQVLSKPGILSNPWRDLYLALGAEFPDGSWSVRLYYKPFVRWIWYGGVLLLIGGLLSLVKSRNTA